MTATEYADCVLCGGEIRDDHDAEKLESGDLAHAGCKREPTAAGTSQGRLGDWGGKR